MKGKPGIGSPRVPVQSGGKGDHERSCSTPDDTRDALRKLGGLLFGLGALMISIRKGRFIPINPSHWASFPSSWSSRFRPSSSTGRRLHRQAPDGRAARRGRPSTASSGCSSCPLALLQFVDMIGGTRGAAAEHLLDLRRSPPALAFYAGAVRGHPLPAAAGLDRGDHLLDRALGQAALGTASPRHFGIYRGLLGILSIAPARRRALPLARRTRAATDVAASATAPRRRPGALEGIRAAHRRRHRGGARLRPRHRSVRRASSLPWARRARIRSGPATLWDVLLLLISLGLVGSARRSAPAARSTSARSGWSCSC